jgi:hypothetical protein
MHLHLSEARRHNATVPSITDKLRPLLRPLPTPQQSPTRPVSGNIFPSAVPPTPIAPTPPLSTPTATQNAGYKVSGDSIFTLEPPSPSPLFPPDLKALFSLKDEEAQTLVQHYGLQDGASSPAASPLHLRPTLVEETPIESREKNLNLFMAHIGVSGIFVLMDLILINATLAPIPDGFNDPRPIAIDYKPITRPFLGLW